MTILHHFTENWSLCPPPSIIYRRLIFLTALESNHDKRSALKDLDKKTTVFPSQKRGRNCIEFFPHMKRGCKLSSNRTSRVFNDPRAPGLTKMPPPPLKKKSSLVYNKQRVLFGINTEFLHIQNYRMMQNGFNCNILFLYFEHQKFNFG